MYHTIPTTSAMLLIPPHNTWDWWPTMYDPTHTNTTRTTDEIEMNPPSPSFCPPGVGGTSTYGAKGGGDSSDDGTGGGVMISSRSSGSWASSRAWGLGRCLEGVGEGWRPSSAIFVES